MSKDASDKKRLTGTSCLGSCLNDAHTDFAARSLPTEPTQRNKQACGKLWGIYINEAKEYDENLVKSWKEDMENILVFSGLYSAVLTAFVIESYPNLQPDPTSQTNTLLKQISIQIINPSIPAANPTDTPFHPTPAALACNILWFTSLALALSSAFLATLIQQWARKFLHRITLERSVGAQADLIKFLYFGIKGFRMHTIIDVIPFLLHLSLFTFFAGFIAFFTDISNVLMWIFVVVLFTIVTMYFICTILPIMNLGSPYATPLSPFIWRVYRLAMKHVLPLPLVSKCLSLLRLLLSWLLRAWQQGRLPLLVLGETTARFLAPALINWFIGALFSIAWIIQTFIRATTRFLQNGKGLCLTIIQRCRTRNRSQVDLESLDGTDRLAQSDAIVEPGHSDIGPAEVIGFAESGHNTPGPAESVRLEEIPLTLLDAIVMESHKRDTSRESTCVEWTLRSLNEDKELLSFIEALPHALEDEHALRIANFHLVKPLLEPRDRSTDIVGRTFDLLRNSTSPWFEKGHRDRCLKACARTFSLLSRVLSEHAKDFKYQAPPGDGHVLVKFLMERRQNALRKAFEDSWSRLFSFEDLSNLPAKALGVDADKPTETGVDVIFRILLDVSGQEERAGVARYLSKCIERDGWGSSSLILESSQRLAHWSTTIFKLKDMEPVSKDYMDAIQELILAAGHAPCEEIYQLLADVQAKVPQSHLAYLITLAAVVATGDFPAITLIREQSLAQLIADPQSQTLEHLGIQWRVLIRCLNLGCDGILTASQVRDILQYFHCYSETWYNQDVWFKKQDWSNFNTYLVRILDFYYRVWKSDPSMENLDINQMLWEIGQATFLEGPFPSYEEFIGQLEADSPDLTVIFATSGLAHKWKCESEKIAEVKRKASIRAKHTIVDSGKTRFGIGEVSEVIRYAGYLHRWELCRHLDTSDRIAFFYYPDVFYESYLPSLPPLPPQSPDEVRDLLIDTGLAQPTSSQRMIE